MVWSDRPGVITGSYSNFKKNFGIPDNAQSLSRYSNFKLDYIENAIASNYYRLGLSVIVSQSGMIRSFRLHPRISTHTAAYTPVDFETETGITTHAARSKVLEVYGEPCRYLRSSDSSTRTLGYQYSRGITLVEKFYFQTGNGFMEWKFLNGKLYLLALYDADFGTCLKQTHPFFAVEGINKCQN